MSNQNSGAFFSRAAERFLTVKKGTILTLLGVLVLLCGLLYGISYKMQDKTPVAEQTTLAVPKTTAAQTTAEEQTAGEPDTTEPAAQTTAATTSAASTTAPNGPLPAEVQGDWKLLLVNQAHPLPANFPVSVKTLPNGQAVDERIYPFLERMLEDARAGGLRPVVCSSYRTQESQAKLFDNKVNKYKQDGFEGEEALARASAWVAAPGTSEHQAGLSVDIVDINNQNLNETQEGTPVSLWLKENCAKYGFIVRYPTDKSNVTGVSYEPWHYRYVGTQAAGEIMSKGITLEEYLGQA